MGRYGVAVLTRQSTHTATGPAAQPKPGILT